MYAKKARKQPKRWKGIAITALLLVGILFAGIFILPTVSPSTAAQLADFLRSIVGPKPVANLESVSFWGQDQVNQLTDDGTPNITLEEQPVVLTESTLLSVLPTEQVEPAVTPMPVTDVVTTGPQIGWHQYGPTVNGEPVMAETLVTLDSKRPYAGIALVRIDMSKLNLHMIPGSLEPIRSIEIERAIPVVGHVPQEDLLNLIAAFNGGFKAVNGQFGMMVDGVTLLPPLPGIATLAIYADGRVRIGTWGLDIFPDDPTLVALRQNCPPIIENGQISPQVTIDDRAIWGETIGNEEITWRTGLGITEDGRYLIYAVGNATSVAMLAQALQSAGAYNAMQLDINQHYAHFVTYEVSDKFGHLKALRLLDQMEHTPDLFLETSSRDFFYLTAK